MRRLIPALPGFSVDDVAIPSENGAAAWVFDRKGRHLRTLDTLTGAVLLSFGYDEVGRLASVTDRDGNRTRIERDATGRPTAVVAPFGQRTALSIGADGLISRIENPAGERVEIVYQAGGLLEELIDPRGGRRVYGWDERAGWRKGRTPREDRRR